MLSTFHRRATGLVVAGLLLVGSAAHAGDKLRAATDAGPTTVRIDNFTFSPPVLTVTPGTTVTWVNQDDIPHTVTANDKVFRSKTMDTDDSYTFTFEKPGEYAYFCSLHPHMTGKIVVKPSPG